MAGSSLSSFLSDACKTKAVICTCFRYLHHDTTTPHNTYHSSFASSRLFPREGYFCTLYLIGGHPECATSNDVPASGHVPQSRARKRRPHRPRPATGRHDEGPRKTERKRRTKKPGRMPGRRQKSSEGGRPTPKERTAPGGSRRSQINSSSPAIGSSHLQSPSYGRGMGTLSKTFSDNCGLRTNNSLR
jgi:hypothetical protein